jgi:hypothetical protein
LKSNHVENSDRPRHAYRGVQYPFLAAADDDDARLDAQRGQQAQQLDAVAVAEGQVDSDQIERPQRELLRRGIERRCGGHGAAGASSDPANNVALYSIVIHDKNGGRDAVQVRYHVHSVDQPYGWRGGIVGRHV